MAMSRLHVTYRISASAADIERRAQTLAIEQSIEMPLDTVREQRIRDEVVGRVESIEPEGEDRFRVVLGLAAETIGGEVAQLVSMVFGNCSLQDDVQLEDVELPPELVANFAGPRGGIAELRALLGVADRPLTSTALKPQGSSVETLAALCRTFALAEIDVVKDDHGIGNQISAPFAERAAACRRAVREAAEITGREVLYAPSLVGPPRALHERARIARDLGIKLVLVSPMVVGVATFHELVESHPELLFLAHPAFAGATRVSPAWLFGRFFRLLGADAVIYPNFGGRFSYNPELCRAIADAARGPWDGVRPAFPVPAGGMTVDRVEELVAFYGRDVMLLIGGGLLSAGNALLERSREFVAKVAEK
jgi:ribulose-bisphosphate carboxylase large chain